METNGKLEKDNLTGVNHGGHHPNTPVKYLTSSSIVGNKVCNHLGEHLGKVKEIMLDINEGKISYMVIEFGGFMGIGDKYFAVPFETLAIDTEHHTFILNQRREVLENAPGFDKEHWPETNSHALRSSSAYWGNFMGPNTGSEY